MTPWARGLMAGAVLGLAAGGLSGSARVDAIVWPEAGGPVVDLRVDEPFVGRLTRPAVGTLGEVRIRRRSWVVASVYDVSLRTAPAAADALGGVRLSVSLPGRVTAPGARVAGGTATWEGLEGPLRARARAVHGVRLAVVAAAGVALWVWGRPPRRS
ncbi:MAG: hypothetical protein QN173_03025 [Armatimonadota bacterium]|nr:hypothetical protein [Armatimonadota bacterium]MDR7401961.1 hypothetical protein [Armatimonadota bacterium]MDR7403658.1 hypothetical protein [Armatimonadota bacterium]MDR7437267.1 hypothetical protein [Armatimonadota bacterium]MDR7471488.1 hypothetical protein [Armatimonadota bacterium]